jgi:hypothetical protein
MQTFFTEQKSVSLLGFVDEHARGNGGGVGKLWEAAACVG